MTDLEKLTALLDDASARAVRIGYALGYSHADRCRSPDVAADGPEFRVLEVLGHDV